MAPVNAQRIDVSPQWQVLCSRQDLVPNSGVVAWLDGAQVALFYLPDAEEGRQLFAVDNHDPHAGANVIGRGIVGHLGGECLGVDDLLFQQ